MDTNVNLVLQMWLYCKYITFVGVCEIILILVFYLMKIDFYF